MSFDVLVFGNGFDGELISIDNCQDELTMQPSRILQLAGSSSLTYQRMTTGKSVSFKIEMYKSQIDGKTYLVATANKCASDDIDMKISWQCPRPVADK